MLGQLAVCSLAAYAFVFIPFKGSNFIFFLFISTMMIPWEATMIPNFFTIQKLDWLNTYQGLTLPFFALAFGTFFLRQHFKTIPKELHEAAQIAGLGRFAFFWRVVLPVSKTSLSHIGSIWLSNHMEYVFMAVAHYDEPIGADCPNRSETIAVPGNCNRMGGGHGWCYCRHCSDAASIVYRTEAVAKRAYRKVH